MTGCLNPRSGWQPEDHNRAWQRNHRAPAIPVTEVPA